MRFVDISADQFGVLENTELNDLSRGLTVVYGGNGSGKSTMVSFLRGVLFGYTTDHEAFQPDDRRFGGSLSLESRGHSYRLTRERSGLSTDYSKVDLATGVAVSPAVSDLPAWVNETVYREIFSVGDQEAARFDLLTRMCLDGSEFVGAEGEIRKAELAIEQCVRERDGNGMEGGLRQKMTSLQHQKDELNGQLTEMRRHSPETPARIAELEAELRRLRTAFADCEQQMRDVTAEIHRLEDLLSRLRRQNTVPLDRQLIEEKIALLTARQQRWADIRQTVRQELTHLSVSGAATMKSRSSLQSIRALVSRLEERMESMDSTGTDFAVRSGVDRDVFVQHLRNEVFSLCDYVTQHETAVALHETSLEALLGQRTLHDVENVETVLQGQIEALRDELQRSENVLLDSNSSHHGLSIQGSAADIEAQLHALRQRQTDLHSETASLTNGIAHIERELAELRLQLKNAARLEDIDRLKAGIADIEAQLRQLQERRDVLDRTETHLRTTLDRLRQYRDPEILTLASEYAERLTNGDCYQLSGTASGIDILAHTNSAVDPMKLTQLSRGTRDQVALALRLALIQHHAITEERCPLILDDVFITSDDERGSATADLLMDIANDGQQILFFTCQNDVKDLFARRNASIRYLDEQPAAVAVELPLTTVRPPEPVIPQPAIKENTNWLYYLEVDNSVEDLSGLTVAEVEALRATRIETVNELLTLSVDDIEQRFQERGYSISRDRIRAWRGQAELATQIPMLRRSDAELLYAAGIQSTVELSRMRPENVYDMVTAFQTSQAGARYRRSGRNIDRQQAINWSRWSQHSRSLTEARSSRSRYFVSTTDTHSSPQFSSVRPSQTRNSSPRQRQARISGSRTSRRRQRRPQLSADEESRLKTRQLQRRERLARHSSSYRTQPSSTDGSVKAVRELRFHLNLSDDVEAAPSIGPKTAQRLARTGIYTVDDLLNAVPNTVATQLDNRRISAEVIMQWQAQARLICQVPELRAHDAQLLVACGVTDPEQLSQKRPVDLLSLVGPFADTTEGERIIRGGKKPDLEEVTDWISWAQQLRPLKAAA